eukprot:4033835-Prymnesium_polylepis.1
MLSSNPKLSSPRLGEGVNTPLVHTRRYLRPTPGGRNASPPCTGTPAANARALDAAASAAGRAVAAGTVR